MKRVFAFSSALFFFVTVIQAAPPKPAAAPTPDFWYVVPGEASPANDDGGRLVQGIVVPTTVRPTVQTTPAGSVIGWQRADGTRQSFAIQGMSSFTFEPGPIANTTHVRFRPELINEPIPQRCCTCASWINSVESTEALACVPGCVGCGCVGCICTPGGPCPTSPEGVLTLVAHNDPARILVFEQSDVAGSVTMGSPAEGGVRFKGRNVTTTLSPAGNTMIHGPESIALPGGVAHKARITDDRAFFAWSSPHAAVILEQPRSIPAPSFRDETIEFNLSAKRRAPTVAPNECRICGTHLNSKADLDIYDCVPGTTVCYRCLTWSC